MVYTSNSRESKGKTSIAAKVRIQACNALDGGARGIEDFVVAIITTAIIRKHQGTLKGRAEKSHKGMRLVMVYPAPLLHCEHLDTNQGKLGFAKLFVPDSKMIFLLLTLKNACPGNKDKDASEVLECYSKD